MYRAMCPYKCQTFGRWCCHLEMLTNALVMSQRVLRPSAHNDIAKGPYGMVCPGHLKSVLS